MFQIVFYEWDRRLFAACMFTRFMFQTVFYEWHWFIYDHLVWEFYLGTSIFNNSLSDYHGYLTWCLLLPIWLDKHMSRWSLNMTYVFEKKREIEHINDIWSATTNLKFNTSIHLCMLFYSQTRKFWYAWKLLC